MCTHYDCISRYYSMSQYKTPFIEKKGKMGHVWDCSGPSKSVPLHQIYFGAVSYKSSNSSKENVWLSSSSSFKNEKFGGDDLFDWLRGEKRRGIHLLVAVVGNFHLTSVS